MARYPRINIQGNDTSCATVADLPKSPDHGLTVYIESLKQAAAYDAIAAAWYVIGPIQKAGAPVDGTSGTGVGAIFPGALCIDTTNTVLYMNANTAASPVWQSLGSVST